jgi:tRNA 2-thiouridine synthesizing protein B
MRMYSWSRYGQRIAISLYDDGATMDKKEIFFLTKPPQSDRTELCLHLMERSVDAVLYLAGDGVYNLLDAAFLEALPAGGVLACREDLEARGVQAGERAAVPESFYELLVEDIVSEGSRIYTF